MEVEEKCAIDGIEVAEGEGKMRVAAWNEVGAGGKKFDKLIGSMIDDAEIDFGVTAFDFGGVPVGGLD